MSASSADLICCLEFEPALDAEKVEKADFLWLAVGSCSAFDNDDDDVAVTSGSK